MPRWAPQGTALTLYFSLILAVDRLMDSLSSSEISTALSADRAFITAVWEHGCTAWMHGVRCEPMQSGQDAGQQARQFDPLAAGGLLHNVIVRAAAELVTIAGMCQHGSRQVGR